MEGTAETERKDQKVNMRDIYCFRSYRPTLLGTLRLRDGVANVNIQTGKVLGNYEVFWMSKYKYQVSITTSMMRGFF